MGTKYKGKTKEISSLNTYIKLIRAGETIKAKISNSLAELKITENQFYCMDAVFNLGPLTQKELGKKLLRSGGNITLVIDNLEKNNLVKRKKDKKDRRKYFIKLTTKGGKLYKDIFPIILSLIVDEFNPLSEKEMTELQGYCKKIGKKL